MAGIEKLTRRHAKGGGAKFVHDQLKREILFPALRPGARLDATGLSERFAMSRSPMREALVRPSAEGLVVTPYQLMGRIAGRLRSALNAARH